MARRPAADYLREIAVRGVADGELLPSATAPQVRAYLRGRGYPCTPLQARVVQEALRVELRDLRTRRTPGDTLGGRLASARKERRLSRAELAQMVGCSESYLSYLESGQRSPSSHLLATLAEVLDKEAEWLRSGRTARSTERIVELLETCGRATKSEDLPQAEACLEELLHGDLGRPLSRHELDQAQLLQGYVLGRRDRDREAAELLDPLVIRLLSGDTQLPALSLGQRYLSAVLFAWYKNEIAMAVMAEAVARCRRVLMTVRYEDRDDDWWRLAATVMWVEQKLGNALSAVAQAESWLAELEQGGADVPSGVAALRWNLAIALVDLGRVEEAAEQIAEAQRLHDAKRYPCDGARLQMVYADILMRAHPEQVGTAIEILESSLPDLERYAYPDDRVGWRVIRAMAEVVAGRPHQVDEVIAPVLASAVDLGDLRNAWLVTGDARALQGDVDEACRAYDRAVEVIRRMPEPGKLARAWRDIGDRYLRLGRHEAALDAYRQALTDADVPERPWLPPWQPGADGGKSKVT